MSIRVPSRESAEARAEVVYAFELVKPYKLIAAILRREDEYYIAFSPELYDVVNTLLLPSPLINEKSRAALEFEYNDKRISALAYKVAAGSIAELRLLASEIRYILQAAMSARIRLVKVSKPLPPRVPAVPEAKGAQIPEAPRVTRHAPELYEIILESEEVGEES